MHQTARCGRKLQKGFDRAGCGSFVGSPGFARVSCKPPTIVLPDAITDGRFQKTAQQAANAMRFARQGQGCTTGCDQVPKRPLRDFSWRPIHLFCRLSRFFTFCLISRGFWAPFWGPGWTGACRPIRLSSTESPRARPFWACYFIACDSTHINSNISEIPSQAVLPAASKGGATSTRSAPMRFTPANSRITCWA